MPELLKLRWKNLNSEPIGLFFNHFSGAADVFLTSTQECEIEIPLNLKWGPIVHAFGPKVVFLWEEKKEQSE